MAEIKALILFFIRRVKHDALFTEAAALSFTSILAMIPALTVILSIFTMIPAFEPLKTSLQTFARNNFMPVFTDAVSENLGTFVANAGSMTVTGSLVLIVVSLMLVRTIDRSINRIWHGGRRRPVITFAIYWTLLTVGPLSVATMLWMTSRFMMSVFSGTDLSFIQKAGFFMLPVFIEAGVLTTMFMALPVAVVRFRDAVTGAVLVTAVFEAAKKIFVTFILNFTDYEAIYGAIAAIPVLMIWVNINWFLVLLGAEFTSALGVARREPGQVPLLLARLAGCRADKDLEEVVPQQRREDVCLARQLKHRVRGLSRLPEHSFLWRRR